jgi:hypothetical protein
VTDNPALDGYIMALHEAPVSYPTFTTTFMESELAVPGDNHFLAFVESEYHITAESTQEDTYNNKLDTSLTSPTYLIATDGSVTLDSYLAGDAPSHAAYTYSGEVFQVDFFIDWGTGYEFFGSDTISINSTASYTSSDNQGHGPGTYSVWVEYSGDSFTDPSNAEEIDLLTYESTTIIPQWSATVEFGGAITLYARLEGGSLGALDGYELLFEKYVGGNWLLIGTDSTNTTGWAEIVYSATDAPNTYSIRVNFTSNSFLANGSIEQSLTVEDTTPPSWVTTPSDQMIEVGSLFDYQLQATDLSGIGLWTINDTTNFVIDSSGRITNITTLLVGQYGLEVTVEDIYSNARIATFTVIVEDSSNPTWDFTPTDQIIEYGSHLSYDLDASDLSGIDSYWVNDTTLFAISPQGVLSDAMTIPVGTHWVEVRAYDPTGNYCSATIRVTVMDTTPPTWVTRPTDQILDYGDALDLSLAASDLSGIALWTINDTTNFAIDSSGRLTSIVTPLPVGSYGLNVTASDPFNNRISGLMTVTIREQTTTTTGGVPGFPLLAIVIGLVVGIGLGIRLRRKQQNNAS